MRGTVISAIYGASAIIVLTFLSVWKWLDPMTPLYVGVGAIFVPALLVAVFLDPETRPPNINVLALAQAALVAGIVGIALPLTWSAPSIRLSALEAFPSKRAVELALEDKSERVQLTACLMIVTDRFEFGRNETYQALVTRPELATACLRELPDDPGSAEVTERLAKVWFQTLMTGQDSCSYVGGIEGLDVAESARASMLLSCSLHGQSSEHRACCADRLVHRYDAQTRLRLFDEGRKLLRAHQTPGYLLAAAWQEKQFVSTLGGIDSKLALAQGTYRAFSADLACESAVAGTAEGDTTISYLDWLFEQHQACLDETQKQYAVESRSACVEFLADPMRSKDLEAALCRADRNVKERRVEASKRVRQGVDLGDFADNIDVGRSVDQQDRLSLSNYKNLVDSGEFMNLTEEENQVLLNSLTAGVPTEEPDAATQAEAIAKAERAKTADGVEELRKEEIERFKGMPDIQGATGISMEEIMNSIGEDGEVSDEMKERLEALKAQHEP